MSMEPARPVPMRFFQKLYFEWEYLCHPKIFFHPIFRVCLPGMKCESVKEDFLGRREGTEVMIAVNRQGIKNDIASVRREGNLINDNTKRLNEDFFDKVINL